MSEHIATIAWKRATPDFRYDSYNRAHEWRFDSGVVVPGSASLAFRGDPERVDPEEAFVAALSSCHMLTFLALAARANFITDAYQDDAVGVMTKNDHGALWVSRVTLRPVVTFSGTRSPTQDELDALHHKAHEECFIAQSVKTQVVVETRRRMY
jgi:organic hydroperoxide reductase OsmC/OhrA